MGDLDADGASDGSASAACLEPIAKATSVAADGVDELFWRNGKCLTVVSDLELGGPIWAGPERRKETLDRFFAERLPPRLRRAVKVVCVDMCAPFLASIREHLPRAAVVFEMIQASWLAR